MYNDPSSFKISAVNILSEHRRSHGGLPTTTTATTTTATTPSTSGAGGESSARMEQKDQIIHILGDLAGYKEQLEDCIETDLTKLTTPAELDELKKETKGLKADIQKSVRKLQYIDENADVAEYRALVDKAKDLITAIDSQKATLHTEKCKTQQEEVFSRVRILASSVDLAFKRCLSKFTVSLETMEDGQLIMLSDNIAAARDEFNDLHKLYFEFVEKCPIDFPSREQLFKDNEQKMTETEEKKNEYEALIMREMQDRELTRNKIQNIKNEIKLPAFNGYGSEMDYYSFKSQFTNKYRRYTSRDQVDILKNTYLKGEAFNTVKELNELDKIWERLKDEFGNPSRMLKDKLSEMLAINPYRIRKINEKSEAILKITNILSDLFTLAEVHQLELELYSKNDKVLGQMLKQLPRLLLHDWQALKKSVKEQHASEVQGAPAWKEDQLNWELFKQFLTDRLDDLKDEALMEDAMKDVSIDENSSKKPIKNSCNNADWSRSTSNDVDDDYYQYEELGATPSYLASSNYDSTVCKVCKGKGHAFYWDCESFMKMKHGERFELFLNPKSNKAPKDHIGKLLSECAACLVPGKKVGHQCHQMDEVKKWLCPESHQRPLHILCCKHHTDSNKKIWDQFQFNTKTGFVQQDEIIPTWKRELKWKVFCFSPTSSSNNLAQTDRGSSKDEIIEKPVQEEAIFLFQRILVDGELYNVFYDLGCNAFCIRKAAATRLGKRATQVKDGVFQMVGVGGIKTDVKFGEYEVRLPLANGNAALFTGPCLDEVTNKFCEYDVSELFHKVAADFVYNGGKSSALPKLSQSAVCGGETDIMLGVKYNRYQPKMVHQMESGLAIYKSPFKGADGSDAVIGGPDYLVTQMENEWARKQNNYVNKGIRCYLSDQLKMYLEGHETFPDSRLNIDLTAPERENSCFITKPYRQFLECEEVGTKSTYRCPDCQKCESCKCGPVMEEMSRKDECHQHLINKSVRFDAHEGKVRCTLPLLQDPAKALANNKKNAERVFRRWVTKLNKNPNDRDSVIRSHDKLKTKGYVASLRELTDEQRKVINGSPAQYFLPWRPVYNESSLSTPCRITWDGSDKTATGNSLNDLIPKGINQINPLLQVVVGWRNGVFAMAGDFEKMYNGILLDENCWSLQQYLWNSELRAGCTPEIYVMKTCTYGVRSSGNQAITGIRLVAERYRDEFPEVYDVLTKQIYVDDVLPVGKTTLDECFVLADQVTVVSGRGGLRLKNFAFTSVPPDKSISADGISIDVAGWRWNTLTDTLHMKIGTLNFGKRYRGKKPTDPEYFIIPIKLTRRICTSKVGEVWDLIGLLVPITARLKLDLHDLVILKLNWDDEIPEELKKLWKENFELINQLDQLQFSRATVPADAVNLEMETIEAGDASKDLICMAVYVRFKRKGGGYSCELVVGKSKIVPKGMSIPRAELLAAQINATLGHLVERAFGDKIVQKYKITDSRITLHWLHSWEKTLKLFVRNLVNETLRLSKLIHWYWIPGSQMPCDIGTRRTATLSDVGDGSSWKEGKDWMRQCSSTFPIKTIEEVKLDAEEKMSYEKEISPEMRGYVAVRKPETLQISNKIKERVQYSNYLLHPNRFRFDSSVRIMGFVYQFILKTSKCLSRPLLMQQRKGEQVHRFKHFFACAEKQLVQDVGMSGLLYERVNGIYVSTPTPQVVEKLPGVTLSEEEINLSLRYFYQKATKEVEKFSPHHKALQQSVIVDEIRFWTGRLLPSQKFVNPELRPMSSIMLDLSSTVFCVPIVDQYSPVAWSLIHEIHWYHNRAKHSGVATTARAAKEYAYILGVKEIAELFRKTCGKCRWIAKRTIDVEFGPLSNNQLKLAPAFYASQADICGPYKAYQINVRATLKIWFAVFVCVVTSTVNIQVMENYSAGSFVAAFIRFASNNGYPKILLPDQGKNIESAARTVEIDWIDVKGKLHRSYGVEVETCGVGGHHQHGKVERKIRQIKETFHKSFRNVRISVLQWQTVAEETANSINNLPVGVGNSRNSNLELDDLDIITPNRLRFGRNNERAPLGPAYISNDPFKFMDLNQEIFESWWEQWLTSAAPQLMEKPVNWKGGDDLEPGDVVLFRKTEGDVGPGVYQYGLVDSVLPSADGNVRNVNVKYRNFDENVDRITKRSVKALILIHKIDELNIMKEMADASMFIEQLKTQIDETEFSEK